MYHVPLSYLMHDSEEILPEETAKVEVPQADNKYWRIPKHIAIIAVCLIMILCVFCASTVALHFSSQAENSKTVKIEDIEGEVFDPENVEKFELFW